MTFANREEAGEKLAEKLVKCQKEKPIILALPRGGVPVGLEIAKKLKAPLQVIVARKLGAPGEEELGIGAISEENVRVLDENLIRSLGINQDQIEKITAREKGELARRIEIYRQGQQLPNLRRKTVILVDDGLATGVTAKAAIEALKRKKTGKIILALPVGSKESIEDINFMVDEVICLETPENLQAIGQWYQDFSPVSDYQVRELLKLSVGSGR